MLSISSPLSFLKQTENNSSLRAQLIGTDSAYLQLLSAALATSSRQAKLVVIVLPTPKEISAWVDFLDFTTQTMKSREGVPLLTAVLPEIASWGSDRYLRQNLALKQRMFALSIANAKDAQGIIVTTMTALHQLTFARTDLPNSVEELVVGREYNQDALVRTLEEMGYRPATQVDEEGSFALRGSILDLFPSNLDLPVRLEFVGDELASIRSFLVETQRSQADLKEVTVFSASEALIRSHERPRLAQKLYDYLLEQDLRQEDREGLVNAFRNHGSFQGIELFLPLFRNSSEPTFSHFPSARTTWIFPRGIDTCVSALRDSYEEFAIGFAEDQSAKRPTMTPADHFAPLNNFWTDNFIEAGTPFEKPDTQQFHITQQKEWAPYFQTSPGHQGMFDQLVDAIKHCQDHYNGTVLILGHHEDQLTRLATLLEHRTLKTRMANNCVHHLLSSSLPPASICLGVGEIASYQWYPDLNVLIIPERMFFGTAARKPRKTPAKLRNLISSFRDLKVGDLIVHITHGVGRYRGMETLDVGGQTSDFLLLEYSGGDRLYLPVDKLNLLQKYQSSDSTTAPLDRMHSQTWEKRKSGVRKSVKDMAEQLLRIQAERKLKGGFRYSPPGDEYYKFEAEFPYEETEDQARAIADVNHDLTSGNSMDRLVCGDVGFGKTEVAIRAAFRVVLDNRQVMLLVPTTVLSYQHYRTFHGRLSHLGVRVGQVNRFVRATEVKEILAQFARGEIDVLIGTHRLLSKDIKPKNLGLLVIDEEQRFGVSHKEKLKEIRANCDVLTLTATPIPRTLHMAVLGLRDISIITTPPADRRFVKTYSSQFDENLIRNAIDFEMQRGGQVFFVHNRVEDIQDFAKFIKSLVPAARIGVGHGQMTENALETVIVDFLEYRYDVLVCTTIIESGIDMPNVNTLIANDADRFGLSQLYQLRGRVGRSDRQAYAYFLTKNPEKLSDDSRKRLEVLLAHQELGSGFQIASHDLELRGAGNLLGGEQSGKIAEVGLELYTQMLDAAIHELQTGKAGKETSDIEIKLPYSVAIPKNYVPDESNRLQTYKSLFSANDLREIDAIRQDLQDRFGQLPDDVRCLILVAELKHYLRTIGAQSFTFRKDKVSEIRFGSLSQEIIKAVLDVAKAHPRRLNLTQDFRLLLHLPEGGERNNSKPEHTLSAMISILLPLSAAVSGSVD